MRIAICLLSIGLLSSCGLGESEAQKVVRENLKDPESAKFGRFQDVTGNSACVEVNAKNSYGGYNGESTYSVMKSKDDGEWFVVSEFDAKKGFGDCVIFLADSDSKM